MARDTSSPYAKKRRKAKDPKANPFKEELKLNRNKKLVAGIAILIVVVMIGTLIFPYFVGGGPSNYRLPKEVLKAKESTENINYSTQNIVLGSTFNRSEKEYYVFFGTREDISEIASKLTRETYYIVDSTLAQNNSLKIDVKDGKSLPQVPKDIKIKDKIALIKIENGKATKFIDNKKEVTDYINKLVK